MARTPNPKNRKPKPQVEARQAFANPSEDLGPPDAPPGQGRAARLNNPPVPKPVADDFGSAEAMGMKPSYADFVKRHGGQSNAYLAGMFRQRFQPNKGLSAAMQQAVFDVAKRRKKAGLDLSRAHTRYYSPDS